MTYAIMTATVTLSENRTASALLGGAAAGAAAAAADGAEGWRASTTERPSSFTQSSSGRTTASVAAVDVSVPGRAGSSAPNCSARPTSSPEGILCTCRQD